MAPPCYAGLRRAVFFDKLAPSLKWRALVAVETDHPAKAAELRGWNDHAQNAMVVFLDGVTSEKPVARETELWCLRNGERERRCVAVYLPSGIDLRLLEGGEMRRTGLARDAPTVLARSRAWRAAHVKAGWSPPVD